MKIALVHLSDIHIRSASDLIFARVENLARAIWSSAQGTQVQYFLVTGDIAFSGEAEQYKAATHFLQRIIGFGERLIETPNPRLIVIPGNHDCQFEHGDDVRDALLNQPIPELARKESSSRLIQALLEPKREFFAFASTLPNGLPGLSAENKTFWSLGDKVGCLQLKFYCFDSALASTLQEEHGRLFLLESDLKAVESLSSPDLSIVLVHHPASWFEDSNGILVENTFDGHADMVFTGHQHSEGGFRKERFSGERSVFFQAAALQGEDEESSGFRTVVVDLGGMTLRESRWAFAGDAYVPGEARGPAWCDLDTSYRRGGKALSFTGAHGDYLEDPGTGFTHPRKETLRLSDLFVAPALKVRRLRESGLGLIERKRVSADDSLGYLDTHTRCLVIGDERSGKTALAKTLVRRLQARGFAPILVKGGELRARHGEEPRKLLDDLADAQLGRGAAEAYFQLDKAHRAIVVDDFHLARLNPRGQSAVVGALEECAGSVTVFADGLFRYEELKGRKGQPSPFLGFDHAEIQEFGYRLRGRLIETWHALGQERVISEHELALETSKSERMVEALLGKKLLPSFPLVILTILQLSEAGREAGPASGSYGSMYEALIMKSLIVDATATDTNVNYKFLSEVARQMFTTDRGRLDKAGLEEVGRRYEEDHAITLGLEARLPDLARRQVLEASDGEYRFSYPYIYYYFVARWFRDAVRNDDDVRRELFEMADRVYSERNSNVLVFYLSLTQDLAVVERILSNAKQIYSGMEPCDFERDVEFLDRLFKGEIEPLALPEGDPARNRDSLRRNLDNEQERRVQTCAAGEQEDAIEYAEDLEDVVKLNISFKTLHVLGQFVRNFPGELKRELKEKIVAECYLLGLRALGAVLGLAESSLPELRQHFAELAKDRRALLSDAEAIRDGDGAVLWLSRGCAFGVVKKISNAVGLETLKQTFRAVRDRRDSTAVALIDISVKLDHFRNVPEKDIHALGKRLRKSYFTSVVLRDLVTQHLVVFGTSTKERQRLVEWLGVEGPKPKLLDNPTRVLKG